MLKLQEVLLVAVKHEHDDAISASALALGILESVFEDTAGIHAGSCQV